jgi:hypothetical protein
LYEESNNSEEDANYYYEMDLDEIVGLESK